MSVRIRVEGLAELRKALKAAEQLDRRAELAAGLKRAADEVAQEAKSRVSSRTGRAAGAIRATSGGNRAYVVEGKKAVPHVGWLDFGSRTPRLGNPRSVGPWAGSGKGPAKGRFVYPALDAREAQVVRLVERAVSEVLRKAGL